MQLKPSTRPPSKCRSQVHGVTTIQQANYQHGKKHTEKIRHGYWNKYTKYEEHDDQ